MENLKLNPRKLRWLLWLRWRLLIRGLTRNAQSAIAFVVTIFFLMACCGSSAFGLVVASRLIRPPSNVELLYVALPAITLLWILLPVFQYGQNEGLDVSKLLLFPLTRGEMMAGLLIAQLVDVLTLGLMLWLIALVVGFTFSPGLLLLNIVAMLIFLGFVVSCSQLVIALLAGMLQNRRFRDLIYIAVILAFAIFYITEQFLLRGVFIESFSRGLAQRQYSPYLAWLPPGWVAHAIEAGLQGHWLASVGWLLLTLLLTLLILYLWQRVLEHTLTQPEVGGQTQARQTLRRAAPAAASSLPAAVSSAITVTAAPPALALEAATTPPLARDSRPWFRRFLSSQTLAIAAKDLRYFRRDPQLLGQLIMPLVAVVVALIAPFIGNQSARPEDYNWFFLIYPLIFVFLSIAVLSLNALGLERKPLTVLFLYPVKPERIFFGKNLAALVPGLTVLLVMLIFEGLWLKLWSFLLPSLVTGVAGIGIVFGWGNLTSVFFPQPVIQRRGSLFASSSSYSGAGCTRGIFQLLMLVVTFLSLVPVILAMLLPLWFGVTWLWIAMAPASLLYGFTFYLLLTRFVAAPALLRRGPEILEIVARD
ncbi:hypothetical protein [Thermogemmatispora sp.]|uniref:hypothetical protein n=1 Tax=Thermogemmatispora sp. TaxID=1968838 RepID=UPI001DE7EDF7|nr:hypothetical protein [Thermogemmatispora sp.]MBX5450981.1 hypothetical protein [Thermogemmatispora sp.]